MTRSVAIPIGYELSPTQVTCNNCGSVSHTFKFVYISQCKQTGLYFRTSHNHLKAVDETLPVFKGEVEDYNTIRCVNCTHITHHQPGPKNNPLPLNVNKVKLPAKLPTLADL